MGGQHPSLAIVGRELDNAPGRCDAQGSLGVVAGQMILELDLEPEARRPAVLAFGEYPTDMPRQRHEPEQIALSAASVSS